MHAAGRQPPAFGDTHQAVSPDGRWLVFEREFAPPSAELDLLPLGRNLTGGGEIRRLAIAVVNWDYTTWMPDSKEILFSSEGSLWRAAILGGHPPTRVPFVGENGIMPAVSRPQPARPSRLVYVRTIDVRNFWRVETSARRSGIVSAHRDHRLHTHRLRPPVVPRWPPYRFFFEPLGTN